MTGAEFNNRVITFVENMEPIALNLTKDMEDARDLLQETMYKAFTNRDKFTDGTNLKAWLYTIMKNIFINNYRRQKKKNTIIDTTDNFYYINQAAHDLPNEGESEMNMEDIQKAIDKLNETYRKPFLMHYRGFKYDEIAEEMEVPIGTVKSRIHLARKQLRKQLPMFRNFNES